MLTWEQLEQTCQSCTGCGLCETRHNVVFGVGTFNNKSLLPLQILDNSILTAGAQSCREHNQVIL